MTGSQVRVLFAAPSFFAVGFLQSELNPDFAGALHRCNWETLTVGSLRWARKCHSQKVHMIQARPFGTFILQALTLARTAVLLT